MYLGRNPHHLLSSPARRPLGRIDANQSTVTARDGGALSSISSPPTTRKRNVSNEGNIQSPASLKHHKDDVGGKIIDISDRLVNLPPPIYSYRDQALAALDMVFTQHASYFRTNPKARRYAEELINETIKEGDVIILLQLLCPVPNKIHRFGVEPNLAFDGFESLTPEQRKRVPTFRAYEALFRDIIGKKIAIFNLRNNCVANVLTMRDSRLLRCMSFSPSTLPILVRTCTS